MEKLIKALIQVWCRNPKIDIECSKLADSMPNRVKTLLKIVEVIFVINVPSCEVL